MTVLNHRHSNGNCFLQGTRPMWMKAWLSECSKLFVMFAPTKPPNPLPIHVPYD